MRLPDNVSVGFQGNLSMTHVADLLQLLHAGGRTGELALSKGSGGKKARFFFLNGELCHAEAGDLTDLEALVEALGFENGEFKFVSGAPRLSDSSFSMPIQFALMEAARLKDEHNRNRANATLNRHRKSYTPPRSFLRDLSTPQVNHQINGLASVLHCHHYISLTTKLAKDMADINGPRILQESTEDSIRPLLDDDFSKNKCSQTSGIEMGDPHGEFVVSKKG